MATHYMSQMISFINNHKTLKKIIIGLDKHLPKPVIALFYGTIAYTAIRKDFRFFYVGIIPLITFISVTIIRHLFNCKRPFEDLSFEPICPHPKGNSCPSRHASSTAVIAVATYYIYPLIGVIIAIISVIISITRVLTGVHYPKDVIIGLLVGYLFGYIGFFIIL